MKEESATIIKMEMYEDMFKEITRKLYGDDTDKDSSSNDAVKVVTQFNGDKDNDKDSSSNDTVKVGSRFGDSKKDDSCFSLNSLMDNSYSQKDSSSNDAVKVVAQFNGEKDNDKDTSSNDAVKVVSQYDKKEDTSFSLNSLMDNSYSQISSSLQSSPFSSIDKFEDDRWISSKESLAWTTSKIASYNLLQKLFRCNECECVGYLSRVAEHWLGTHANLRVFQCPQCSYASAWARCVRMHLAQQHNVCQETSGTLWKESPVLEEVTKYLERLKSRVEDETHLEEEEEEEDLEEESRGSPTSTTTTTTITTTPEVVASVTCHPQTLDKTVQLFIQTKPSTLDKTFSFVKTNAVSHAVTTSSPAQTLDETSSQTFVQTKPSSPQNLDKTVQLFVQTKPSTLDETVQLFVETKPAQVQTETPKRYNCAFCHYATDRRDLYTRHENIHKEEKPFFCYVCLKQFNRADHIKKHFLRMHRDQPYDMNKAKRETSGGSRSLPSETGGQLTSSEAGVPPPQIIQQQIITTMDEFVTKRDTSTISSEPGIITTLEFLQKPASKLVEIDREVIRQPLNIPGFPVVDQVVKIRPGGLSQIVEIRPGGLKRPRKRPEKKYSCNYCSWTGVDNWVLKRHLNTHIKPYTCNMCEYKAARSERLALHVFKVHNKHLCSRCSFLGDDQTALSAHQQTQHGL